MALTVTVAPAAASVSGVVVTVPFAGALVTMTIPYLTTGAVTEKVRLLVTLCAALSVATTVEV